MFLTPNRRSFDVGELNHDAAASIAGTTTLQLLGEGTERVYASDAGWCHCRSASHSARDYEAKEHKGDHAMYKQRDAAKTEKEYDRITRKMLNFYLKVMEGMSEEWRETFREAERTGDYVF